MSLMNLEREKGNVQQGVISHFVNATAFSDVWVGFFFPLEKV